MKILKVYDKINRNTFKHDQGTGNVVMREFYSDTDYITVIINTKVFKLKNDKLSYFSFIHTVNDIARETMDLTSKYIFFKVSNEKGMLTHSERIHLKDNKSILLVDRIYDEVDEFIEIENHRGRS